MCDDLEDFYAKLQELDQWLDHAFERTDDLQSSKNGIDVQYSNFKVSLLGDNANFLNSGYCFLRYFRTDITAPYPGSCVRTGFIGISDEKDSDRFVTLDIFSMFKVNR